MFPENIPPSSIGLKYFMDFTSFYYHPLSIYLPIHLSTSPFLNLSIMASRDLSCAMLKGGLSINYYKPL